MTKFLMLSATHRKAYLQFSALGVFTLLLGYLGGVYVTSKDYETNYLSHKATTESIEKALINRYKREADEEEKIHIEKEKESANFLRKLNYTGSFTYGMTYKRGPHKRRTCECVEKD